MSSHVLILGCGRSGTSIFGELFQELHGYTYLSEPPWDDLAHRDFRSSMAIKVPRESKVHDSTPGLSFPLDQISETLPEPRTIFWIVRHPLDAIASLKIGIAQNWGHHPRPPDWRDWLGRPIVEQCAYHWNHIHSVGFPAVESMVVVKKFESMIRDPLAFAQAVFENAGIDSKINQEAMHRWADRVQDSNNEKFVEAQTSRNYSRPDHTKRVGRWQENLSTEDLRGILPLIRESAKKFSYELPE